MNVALNNPLFFRYILKLYPTFNNSKYQHQLCKRIKKKNINVVQKKKEKKTLYFLKKKQSSKKIEVFKLKINKIVL